MTRPIRTIDGYYEATGPNAVNREYAAHILETGIQNVAQYAGPIVLNRLRGARLPLAPDMHVSPRSVRLSTEPHTALVTRRLVNAEGVESEGAGGAACVSFVDGSSSMVYASRIAISALPPKFDPVGSLTIASAGHEISHSLGIQDHCETEPACTMRPELRGVAVMATKFCVDCAENLEFAGYQAMAVELSRPTPAAGV